MPELVEDLSELPQGSHCLSLHLGRREAAEHAASFLAGTVDGQTASYWVGDSEAAESTRAAVLEQCPEHIGCVAILPHEQVEPDAGRLRPAHEIKEFLREHPGGVTAAGETLTMYWAPESMPAHLEYETWFQEQPRDSCRFMCPYDLRMIPAHLAPEVLRDLGAHHSHIALSSTRDPVAQTLELFVFPSAADLPSPLRMTLERSLNAGWVSLNEASGRLSLTSAGEEVVQQWSDRLAGHADSAMGVVAEGAS
jgi:hypothetical protein